MPDSFGILAVQWDSLITDMSILPPTAQKSASSKTIDYVVLCDSLDLGIRN